MGVWDSFGNYVLIGRIYCGVYLDIIFKRIYKIISFKGLDVGCKFVNYFNDIKIGFFGVICLGFLIYGYLLGEKKKMV